MLIPVSSGCITCIVRLINEKGEECVNPRNSSTMQKPLPAVEHDRLPSDHTLISNDKLFMMTQYMKEAMFRESVSSVFSNILILKTFSC